jgi:hypothetical protein
VDRAGGTRARLDGRSVRESKGSRGMRWEDLVRDLIDAAGIHVSHTVNRSIEGNCATDRQEKERSSL